MKKRLAAILLTLIATVFLAVACVKESAPDNSIRITYYSCGEEYYSETFAKSDFIVFPKNPQENGYEFAGWYLDEDFSEESKLVRTYLFHTDDKNVKAYAKFNKVTYTVTYSVDDRLADYGQCVNNPSSYDIETDFNLLPCGAAKQGYTFRGWYDQYDMKVDNFKGVFGDKVLTAKFDTEIKQYTRDGDYIYFGSYPQSRVTDQALLDKLNGTIGALPNERALNGWTLYTFYSAGQRNKTMWYKDVSYGEDRYRAVYFTKYRAANILNANTTENGAQKDNGYFINEVYWFLFQPVKWKILSVKDGIATIFSDIILDSGNVSTGSWTDFWHDGQNVDDNYWGWFYSSLRLWLDGGFSYDLCTVTERDYALIMTAVQNDAESTVWQPAFSQSLRMTTDNFFLLSHEEIGDDVTERSFNTEDAVIFDETTRVKGHSDYALCQGLAVSENGYGGYWLRSLGRNEGSLAQFITCEGVISQDKATSTLYGVAPACRIKL